MSEKVKVIKYEKDWRGRLLTDCPYGSGLLEAGVAKVGSAWCTSCEFCEDYDYERSEVTCSHPKIEEG